MNHEDLLAYYATPGPFTGVEGFEEQVDALPNDIASIADAVQSLLLHEAWAPAYEVKLSEKRTAEKELHTAVAMLRRAAEMDAWLLSPPRADRRVVGVCRHFATLFVAVLRHKGIPARARVGFASYFEPDKHVDHWTGEYWNHEQDRWILVDAQLDELQRTLVQPDFDTLDVPRDRFIIAGDAWRMCRSGEADPMSFGVGGTDLWGLEEIMGDVFQDLAALQKVELLPWGWYGLASEDGMWERELPLIDRLAALSSTGDAGALAELRLLTANDARLAVPLERVEMVRAAEVAA